jgi:hypothetical protein
MFLLTFQQTPKNEFACTDMISEYMIMDEKHALQWHIPTKQHTYKNYSSKNKILLCHIALSL